VPLATIARAVVELTASDDHIVVSRATLFAQDGCRLLPWRDFRRVLVEAGFLDTLRANLTKPAYFIRRDAVVVLGRMFAEGIVDLVRLFPRCLERDPLLLDPILAEIRGVAGREGREAQATHQHWGSVQTMAGSPSYLTRWAAVHVVDLTCRLRTRGGRYLPEEAEAVLRFLVTDRHPRVRAEAVFRLRELRALEGTPAPPLDERLDKRLDEQRRPRQAGSIVEPLLTFSAIEQTFERYLWMEGVADYDRRMLDAWVHFLERNPLSRDERHDLQVVTACHRHFTTIHRT
jgi:hypothetical protein